MSKKEEGNIAYKARRFDEALSCYRAAWDLDGGEDIACSVLRCACPARRWLPRRSRGGKRGPEAGERVRRTRTRTRRREEI